jgi:hypothetical protein
VAAALACTTLPRLIRGSWKVVTIRGGAVVGDDDDVMRKRGEIATSRVVG